MTTYWVISALLVAAAAAAAAALTHQYHRRRIRRRTVARVREAVSKWLHPAPVFRYLRTPEQQQAG
ncbi:hypothetical protein [Umezawaea sp. Da 62-37]|uniref:hypothetical protein n=1 Tax=Umezawaea sp. Da 62-37 TaxID=3075927 RepID=UPI0028F6F6BC|nr:hypothetical protein [Umezawaea sp. Da 62-37]WNV90127.1 hypothetical protein RM788_18060 [Umezawaea sp. Da 62-37]